MLVLLSCVSNSLVSGQMTVHANTSKLGMQFLIAFSGLCPLMLLIQQN